MLKILSQVQNDRLSKNTQVNNLFFMQFRPQDFENFME